MKRILLLLIIPAIIIGLASCTNPASQVGTPTNLAWTVGTNGIDLTLSWDAVDDADGYIVIVPAGDTVEPDTNTEYIFTDAEVGTYSVLAFASAEYGTAATLSNAPYEETTAMTIYPLSSTSGGSGFDLDPTNGHAEIVSLADDTYKETFDFYLNDDSSFVSADDYTFTSGNGVNTTGFINNGTTEPTVCTQYVALSTYNNFESCVQDNYLMVYFLGSTATPLDNYGIIKITAVTADNIVFTYKYQTLKGFRKF